MKNFILPNSAKNKLRELGVVALYLFGSRARAQAGPLSDYDFAVLMNDEGYKRGDKLYDKLYDLLSPLCPRTLENDVIDIVFLKDVPLELRFHVIRYGKIIYETNLKTIQEFEVKTELEYCDFKPILDMFDKAVLQRV